ncbi:hypothetical protein ACFQGE_00370 [Halomicroarcula sp. GCM10025817]|uniref:hypothetical protein n=1 Tax=Haloarcula TaxID=2237 RepID=UPI0023E84F73|nr:hypothetical protein [Halomicroarcula sp. SYNS111]
MQQTRKNRVPVGATPIPRYGTWDEHREALRLEAMARRREADAKRNVVQNAG